MNTLLITKLFEFNLKTAGIGLYMGYGGFLVVLIISFLLLGIASQRYTIKAIAFLGFALSTYEIIQLIAVLI